MHSTRRALLVALLLAVAACHPDFELTRYPNNEALYRAAMQEMAAGRWDNAVTALEKLTTDLPARDTLLPRAHWYLAKTHDSRGEFVLAATSYTRLVESFPDDSLSDDAALAAARDYKRLWRKPTLDPTYGETALATYNTLLGLYPQSPLLPEARKEVTELEEMFAQKGYLAGVYYYRRKAYDSGIIYFKDVIAKWPNSVSSKLAQMRLVDSYKAIHYRDDAQDACAALKKNFPNDADVAATCAGVAATLVPAATTGANTPPSSTGPPSAGTPPTF